MSEELRPCPFCGEMPETDGRLVQCYLMPCSARNFKMSIDSWNARPIEDALNARIAELDLKIASLKDKHYEMANELEGKRFFTDTLYYDIYRLQSRIAELEALVDELKPYRDGYDAYEDFPEEGENVIANLGSWLFFAQRRGDKWFDSLGQQAEIRGGVERWWKLPEVQE